MAPRLDHRSSISSLSRVLWGFVRGGCERRCNWNKSHFLPARDRILKPMWCGTWKFLSRRRPTSTILLAPNVTNLHLHVYVNKWNCKGILERNETKLPRRDNFARNNSQTTLIALLVSSLKKYDMTPKFFDNIITIIISRVRKLQGWGCGRGGDSSYLPTTLIKYKNNLSRGDVEPSNEDVFDIRRWNFRPPIIIDGFKMRLKIAITVNKRSCRWELFNIFGKRVRLYYNRALFNLEKFTYNAADRELPISGTCALRGKARHFRGT